MYILKTNHMRYVITISCSVLFAAVSYAEISTQLPLRDTTIQTSSSISKRKKEKGDTLIYYEVLRLKDMDQRQQYMVVFARSVIEGRRSAAKLQIRYLLKRERAYLEKIFFTKAMIIESKQTELIPVKVLNELSVRYKGISIWTILDVNQFFNKTLPR
jgi:hypothetical protein